jgi:hypothetical protein
MARVHGDNTNYELTKAGKSNAAATDAGTNPSFMAFPVQIFCRRDFKGADVITKDDA